MSEHYGNSDSANEHSYLLKKDSHCKTLSTKRESFYRRYFGEREILVDLLAILFGIGAWIGVNGMFVELPLIVEQAPETWSLPSYMTITVQLANLGPILYVLLRKCTIQIFNEVNFIYCLLLISCIALILTSFNYDVIAKIGGENHSAVFLILLFFISIGGCTSSVLFFPYMRHFKEIYLISYFIGEGLSGFLASSLALIQGIGSNTDCGVDLKQNNGTDDNFIPQGPLLSVHIFFLLIFLMMCASLISFILLNHMKVCKKELVPIVNQQELTSNQDHTNHEIYNDDNTVAVTSSDDNTATMAISKYKAILLLIFEGIICAFSNGVFPALQSYSCLPYGNTAYHLSVSLSTMANPLACFLALFLPQASKRAMVTITAISSMLTIYVIMTAVWSLSPPLAQTTAGIIIVILSWTFVVGLNSFIKLFISTTFRSIGGSWMFYCGIATQSGSAVGSLVSFLLIKYTEVFTVVDPCK